MPTYKNIRIPKRGGGIRTQRVQVLRNGKYKFVKNLNKSSKSKGARRSNPKTKRRKNTTTKKKNSRRNNSMGNGLEKVFNLVGKLAPRITSHTGVAYMGYDVTAPGLSGGERLKRFGTNELLIRTGIDVMREEPGLTWNIKPMMVQTLANINPAKKISSIVNKLIAGI